MIDASDFRNERFHPYFIWTKWRNENNNDNLWKFIEYTIISTNGTQSASFSLFLLLVFLANERS